MLGLFMRGAIALAAADKPDQLTENQNKKFNKRNIITTALGYKTDPIIDIRKIDILPGDVLAATSDGVHDPLTDKDLLAILRQDISPEDMVEAIQNAVAEKNLQPKTVTMRGKFDDSTVGILKF